MKRLLIVGATLALILATPAQSESGGREIVKTTLAPNHVFRAQTRHSFAPDAQVYVSVLINGKDAANTGVGQTVDWSVRGVIVRTETSAHKTAPLVVKAANLRSQSVRIRVEMRWE